jgi:hypothetical protein
LRPGASLRTHFRKIGIATSLAIAVALLSPTLPLPFSLAPANGPLVAEAAPTGTSSSNSVYYRQTGHYIKDAFLNYWLMNGGLTLYGYPVTEETQIDGVPVQYFQRSRFEYHADSRRPWNVELTAVGSLVTQGRNFEAGSPESAGDGKTYFAQTGHMLGGTFASYWSNRGGVSIFGYPISEEIQENGMTVQYFERARFELGSRGRVQLGQLGVELLNKQIAQDMPGLDPTVASPVARPGYQMSFHGEATWFSPHYMGTSWERIISLNKQWGNLAGNFVGRGLYAAAPADLGLYGRMARVTRGNYSVNVQFVDVIAPADISYVRSKGIVIDLGEEAYRALGPDRGGRYEASFDVFWPGEEP